MLEIVSNCLDVGMTSLARCAWCGTDPIYVAYHDTEWGRPERDPRALWEALCLESFQAGLSWITILRRRSAFKAAFAGFDPSIVATWGEDEVERLLQDTGIIRHRGKITATLNSAKIFLGIDARIGFSNFIWNHVDQQPLQPNRVQMSDVPTNCPQALTLSQSLKSAGFKFCGPTIVYAFMEAVGMVNDHQITCHRHAAVKKLAINPNAR